MKMFVDDTPSTTEWLAETIPAGGKVAFDGSRLAVCAVTLGTEKVRTGGYPHYTGILTQVYTEDGLQYSSAMHSSITDAAGYPRGDQQTWTTNDIHIQSFGWK